MQVDAVYGPCGQLTASGSGATAANGNVNSYIPVKPGEVWALSVDVWTNDPTAVRRAMWIRATWLTAEQVANGSANAAPAGSLSTVVTRLGGTVTVPDTGVAFLRFDVFISNTGAGAAPATGQQIRWAKCLAEKLPAVLPPFDGSTVDGSGVACSWEGAAGASPSIARASVVEVRRNIQTNPIVSLGLGSGGWQTLGTPTVTTIPGVGAQLEYASGYSGSVLYRANATEIPATAGTWIAATFDVEVPIDAPAISLHVQNYWYGTTSEFGPTGGGVRINPGERKLVTVASAAPAGTTHARPTLRTATLTPAGARFIVRDGVTYERASTLLPPFTGAMTPDANLAPSWAGAENASESILNGVATADYNVGGTGRLRYRTWSGRMAIMDITTAGPAGVNVVTNISTLGVGRTYTVLAEVTIPVGYDAAADPDYARGIYLWTYSAIRAQAPATPGTHRVRLTFTVPDSSQSLRLCGGAKGQTVEWDSLCIVEGVYSGPYIDGDMPGCIWRGVPHGSISAGYPRVA